MFEYRAFISHNKNDSQIAQKIGSYLIENNIDVWFDKWSVYAGDSLTDEISKGINASNIFILLASKNSMSSKWVREELKIALNRRISDQDFRIITIKLDICKLHPFLTDYFYINFMNRRKFKSVMNLLITSILQIKKNPSTDQGHKFYENIKYSIHFSGIRGSKTEVIEVYEMIPLREVEKITKHIYFSGELIKKEVHSLTPLISATINIIEKTTALERFDLLFNPPLKKNVPFIFAFKHVISDNFFNNDEFVYYTIEAETKKVDFSFKFDRVCPVDSFRALKRLGQKEEILKNFNGKYNFNFPLVLPELNEIYTFRWTWKS